MAIDLSKEELEIVRGALAIRIAELNALTARMGGTTPSTKAVKCEAVFEKIKKAMEA